MNLTEAEAVWDHLEYESHSSSDPAADILQRVERREQIKTSELMMASKKVLHVSDLVFHCKMQTSQYHFFAYWWGCTEQISSALVVMCDAHSNVCAVTLVTTADSLCSLHFYKPHLYQPLFWLPVPSLCFFQTGTYWWEIICKDEWYVTVDMD